MTIEPLPRDFDYHLSSKEREQVECIVPMHQAKIHLAFRANLVFDGKSYQNSAVALSEHMVTLCSRGVFGRNLKLLYTFHLFDVISCRTLDDNTAALALPEHEMTIVSPTCMRFVRNMLRNYILSAPLMPGKMRFKFQAHDAAHFPPFRPNLSPSQEFQFAYNANCSYYDTTYHHDIPRYFHYLLTTGNGVFDMTQLPIHILEDALGESTDVRPITGSLCFCPYLYGFTCENVTKSDLVKACAAPILMNSNLRMIRLVDTGSTDGCKEIATAMMRNEGSKVVYWDLSEHKMDISHFGQALGSYTAPVVSLKLTNCQMDGFEMTTLLTSLIENEFLYEIRQLCLSGNRMTTSHTNQLAEFLRRTDGTHLEVLEIGPVQGLEVIVESLVVGGHQLQKLKLIDTSIAEKGESALVDLIGASDSLDELDLSGCQLSATCLESILGALSQNNRITQLKLRLNRLDSRSMLDLLRKPDRKTEHLIAFLEKDESLRNKLTALSLNNNSVSQDELSRIVALARQMANLRELSLSGNFSTSMSDVPKTLISLLELPNVETLLLAGGDGFKFGEAIISFIGALINNSTLKRVDLSNNEIGDAGLKKLATVLRNNTVLSSVSVDGSKPKEMSTITELLDVVAQSDTLIDFSYPIEDIYDIVTDLDDERRARSFELLAHLQATTESKLSANRAKMGVFSRLTLLHDKVLDELLDQITVDLQQKLSGIAINQHLSIAKVVGLPLPFETDALPASKTEQSADDDGRELYVSRNFMEPISESSAASHDGEEPSTTDFHTLQFNSLLIRRPDSRQKLLRKTGVLAPGELPDPQPEEESSVSEPTDSSQSEEEATTHLKPTGFGSSDDEPSPLLLGKQRMTRLPSTPVVHSPRKTYSGRLSPRRGTDIEEQLISPDESTPHRDARRMSLDFPDHH